MSNLILLYIRSEEQLGNGKTQLNAWTIVQILAFHAMLLLSLFGNTPTIKAVTGNMKTTVIKYTGLWISVLKQLKRDVARDFMVTSSANRVAR